jgi:hypothetical protein
LRKENQFSRMKSPKSSRLQAYLMLNLKKIPSLLRRPNLIIPSLTPGLRKKRTKLKLLNLTHGLRKKSFLSLQR